MKRFDNNYYHIYPAGVFNWADVLLHVDTGTLYRRSGYREKALYCLDVRVSQSSVLMGLFV